MDLDVSFLGVRMSTARDHCILRGVLAVIFVAVLFARSSATDTRRICFKNACVEAEVADTEQSRQTGLMFRSSLAENSGMLFVFERKGIYSFWMKNTLIALDMLWLDQDLRVVAVKTHVPACTSADCPSITPQQEALFVLEVNAGFVDAHRIAIGEVARFADE